MVNEYITGYVIDNYDMKLYRREFRLNGDGIRDVIKFNLPGLQKRTIGDIEYGIICERYLKPGFVYPPSTMINDKPDIKGSIIIVRLDNRNKPISLMDSDIEYIEEFISMRADKEEKKFEILYTVSVKNPYGYNIQTTDINDIEQYEKVI